MIDRHELFCLLALQKIFYQHPRIVRLLLDYAGNASNLFKKNRNEFREFFGVHGALWNKFNGFNSWKYIERYLKDIESRGLKVVGFGEEGYPTMLKNIYDPPPILIARGKGMPLLNSPCISIVGSRKASNMGKEIAASIAEKLALRGYCVVSGLAYGIDSAAHRGALCGTGETIAVMGCGLDQIYPAAHIDLSRRITEQGLLLSEFPLGAWPCKSHFPQRNRIISGLSMAVLVVEAALPSGSLITAKLAAEQGRDVFAVPGTGGVKTVSGSNGLLRDGAMLVEDGDEIADVLDEGLHKWPFLKKSGHLSDDMSMDSPLLSAIPKRGGVTIDYLVEKTGIDVVDVLKQLTELSLDDAVEELPGRRFRLKGV